MKPEANQNQILHEKIAALEPLVEKAIAGDGDAVRIICEELGKGILFRINYMLGSNANEMDAEDVSQEVFLRICESITTLREPKAFRKWLSSIITNETTQFLRGKMKRGTVLDINDYFEDIVDENTDYIPENYVSNNELRREMLSIIAELPTRQRQAIIHHYYDDFSIMEVAEVMKTTQQGASKNLSLAIKRIKSEIEKLPSTAVFGTIPTIPVESALREVLQADEAHFMPANPDWLQMALAPCEQYFIVGSALATGGAGVAATTAGATTAATAATAATTAVATTSASATVIASVVLTCTLLVAPIIVSNMESIEPQQRETHVVSGEMVFSGGVCLGEHYKRINPESVRPSIDEDITILEWWIINENDEVILRSDADSNLEEVKINPREIGPDGVYSVIFRFKNEPGFVYTISCGFVIENE